MQLKLTEAEGSVLERARAAVGARSGVDVVRGLAELLRMALDEEAGGDGEGGEPLILGALREQVRRQGAGAAHRRAMARAGTEV